MDKILMWCAQRSPLCLVGVYTEHNLVTNLLDRATEGTERPGVSENSVYCSHHASQCATFSATK